MKRPVVLFCPLFLASSEDSSGDSSGNRFCLDPLTVLGRQLTGLNEGSSQFCASLVLIAITRDEQESVSKAMTSAKKICYSHGVPFQVRLVDVEMRKG